MGEKKIQKGKEKEMGQKLGLMEKFLETRKLEERKGIGKRV